MLSFGAFFVSYSIVCLTFPQLIHSTTHNDMGVFPGLVALVDRACPPTHPRRLTPATIATKAPARPMRAATPAVTGCRSGALHTGRKTPVLRKTGVLYNRVRSCLAPATAEPLPGYKTEGFAQAPAQFKAPAATPGRASAARLRPTLPPFAPAGGNPWSVPLYQPWNPLGVPGLIYAAHNRTNCSG